MPELPEVETVRIGLARLIIGRAVESVEFDWPKSFPNAPSDVEAFMIGASVIDVRRRAKVLMIDLSSGYTLVTHLKMTGQLVYVNQIRDRRTENEDEQRFGAGHPNDSLIGKLPDKSTRVTIKFSGGPNSAQRGKKSVGLGASARKGRSAEQAVLDIRRASTADHDAAIARERWQSFGLCPKAGQRGPTLFFNDQRKFGWMRLIPTSEVPNIDFMKRVGPEPLGDDFTVAVFAARLARRKNSAIKAVLLDQTVLAGVGNIYADESLWGAKIHPETKVSDLSATAIKRLYTDLREVLALSIAKGGSTDRNYVNAEGKKGSYLDFARVFRRDKLPCPRCATTIIKLRVAGRGTHICPKCQRAGR